MGRQRSEERTTLIRLKTKRPERISVVLLQRGLHLKGRGKYALFRRLRSMVLLKGKYLYLRQ